MHNHSKWPVFYTNFMGIFILFLHFSSTHGNPAIGKLMNSFKNDNWFKNIAIDNKVRPNIKVNAAKILFINFRLYCILNLNSKYFNLSEFFNTQYNKD